MFGRLPGALYASTGFVLAAALTASSAMAEGPPPQSPAPSPSPSAAPDVTVEPAPSPTASPEGTPPVETSAPPSATPAAPDGGGARAAESRISAEHLERLRRVLEANSLLERIEARRALIAAERSFLAARIDQARAEHEALVLQVAETRARADARRIALEDLLRRAYRESHRSPVEILLERGSIVSLLVHLDGLASLSERERRAAAELRAAEADLAVRRDALLSRGEELVALTGTLGVKDELLESLAAQAERLASAAARGEGARVEAEIALLREVADEAIRAHAAEEEIIARLARDMAARAPALAAWVWPLDGPVTQEFGPSTFALAPPRVHGGAAFPHFHDGLDIAAPMGTVIRSASAGVVLFVGHLPDGAMVVIVGHDDGTIALYGHLDDVLAPPPVRAGDRVAAGDQVGAVGLTGLTTGPHLHFVVRRGVEPIDPRIVLPPHPDRSR